MDQFQPDFAGPWRRLGEVVVINAIVGIEVPACRDRLLNRPIPAQSHDVAAPSVRCWDGFARFRVTPAPAAVTAGLAAESAADEIRYASGTTAPCAVCHVNPP